MPTNTAQPSEKSLDSPGFSVEKGPHGVKRWASWLENGNRPGMYLNLVQLAESLGVEERVAENWVREEGLPSVTDRGRLLFDRAQVVAWAAERGLVARAGFLAPRGEENSPGMQLAALLRRGGIWRDIEAQAALAVLEQVVSRLPGVTEAIRSLLLSRLRGPGGVTWAPVGGGFALPHLRAPMAMGRDSGIVALLFISGQFTEAGAAADGVPVTRLLFFIAPTPRAHLDFLAQLSRSLGRVGSRQAIVPAASDASLLAWFEGAGKAGGFVPGLEATP